MSKFENEVKEFLKNEHWYLIDTKTIFGLQKFRGKCFVLVLKTKTANNIEKAKKMAWDLYNELKESISNLKMSGLKDVVFGALIKVNKDTVVYVGMKLLSLSEMYTIEKVYKNEKNVLKEWYNDVFLVKNHVNYI